MFAPAFIELAGHHIVRAGSDPIDGITANYPDLFLLPALVNAHAHLDLTHIGPRPYSGTFVEWIEMVRSARPSEPDAAIRSIERGVELARAGGTGLIGDIAGSGVTAKLPGVSFGEFFGHGSRQQQAAEAMAAWLSRPTPAGVRPGLQPHAPYSAGVGVYAAACRASAPLCTHLAETLEEIAFTRHATGPLAEMLRKFGVWDDSVKPAGLHPVDLLAPHLSTRQWLLAHLNYVEPQHLRQLAGWDVSVAYCPRASAYFGHPQDDQPPHQYRAMLDAGINVALGTDSIVCLDTPDRISVLDDMRTLAARDQANFTTLLQMATVNGAAALGFDAQLVSLAQGPTIGIIGIPLAAPNSDPGAMVTDLLSNDQPPRWVAGPFDEELF